MTALFARPDRSRIFALWVCLALFLTRVLGQVEVVLVSPAWLPNMEYWYSGLLPYPVLLPIQILLLMAMTAMAWHVTREKKPAADGKAWRIARILGIVYFFVMAMRLVVQALRGAPDLLSAGAIPVAFHFVLALFLLLYARPPPAPANPGDTIVGLRLSTPSRS